MIQVIGEITEKTLQDFMRHAHQWPYYDTLPDPLKQSGHVLISSPGGDIGYTLAMLDEIDESKRTTKATGICQSAAAVLATAGEGKRICTADTLFRFMPAQKEKMKEVIDGQEVEVEKIPDLRAYLQSVLVARLAGRLKTPVADISLLFDGEFVSSVRAKELGLIDEIIFTEAPHVERNSSGLSGSQDGFDFETDSRGSVESR